MFFVRDNKEIKRSIFYFFITEKIRMFRQKKSFAKSGEGVQSPVSKLIFKISFRLLKMHYILEVEIDEEKIKTPIETNQQTREIAEIEFVEFECS